MEMVPIHDLKARLAELVEAASRGARVIITKHNHPVAALVPVEPPFVRTGARFGQGSVRPLPFRARRSIEQVLADDRARDR